MLIGDVISLENLGAYRLKDLGEPVNIYQVSAPALQKEFPPLRSVDTVANNLPLYIDSFVGRVNELSEIVDALNHCQIGYHHWCGWRRKNKAIDRVGRTFITEV